MPLQPFPQAELSLYCCVPDPEKTAGWAHLKYWNYSVNEMGMEDCTAQLDHIHVVKCRELNINAGPALDGGVRPEGPAVEAVR